MNFAAPLLSNRLAKLILDAQRWQPSDWRWVLGVWAYLWIVVGIWFTVSPWRCRDIIEWKTATDTRVKIGCAFRLALGVLVAVLGATVFR